MDDVKSLGASWLRIDLWWGAIEPSRGRIQWAALDSIVASAARSNIQLLVTVRGYTQTTAYPQDDASKRDAYRLFVTQLARRYQRKVHYWQIENEVTSKSSWQSSLAVYLDILRIASAAIRSAGLNEHIVLSSFGSMPSDLDRSGSGWKVSSLPPGFATLISEAAPNYDIADAHVYLRPEDITQYVQLLRQDLARNKRSQQVWLTETGGPDSRLPLALQSRDQVSDEVIKRYSLALDAGASCIFWHQLSSNPSAKESSWSVMGLMLGEHRRDAFYAYKLLVQQVTGFTSVARVSTPTALTLLRFSYGPSRSVFLAWADSGTIYVRLGSLSPHYSVAALSGTVSYSAGDTVPITTSPVFIHFVP